MRAPSMNGSCRVAPTDNSLGPTEGDGIARECAVNCDHLQTVAKGRIGSLVTTLPPARMREIRSAIAFALGLSD